MLFASTREQNVTEAEIVGLQAARITALPLDVAGSSNHRLNLKLDLPINEVDFMLGEKQIPMCPSPDMVQGQRASNVIDQALQQGLDQDHGADLFHHIPIDAAAIVPG